MKTAIKYLITSVIFFAAGLSLMYFVSPSNQTVVKTEAINEPNANSLTVRSPHTPFNVASRSEVTCRYPRTVNGAYTEGAVQHSLNEPESSPIIITFTNLDTDMPTGLFMDVTESISEVQMAKVYEDDELAVLIEGLNGFYSTMHTIYFDKAVASYSKHTTIFGIATSNTSAVGTCK